jgi:TatD DNase family protein
VIDSHCHLADEAFEGHLEGVIQRAREAGVTGALCILAAGDEAEAGRARDVQARWGAVRFATGVHPHAAAVFAGRAGDSAHVTREHAAAFRACAVGEIGLDYHYDFDLARELGLPVVVHTREATEDTFAILESAGGIAGVFHCFTGDAAMARRALDIGFYVSFAGIVTFPKAETLREAAKLIPPDRLLAETDSPYLAPVPHRGKRNEPAYLARVVEALAMARVETVEALEARIAQNFARLFPPSHVG